MNRTERVLLWSSNLWNFTDGMLGPLFAVFTERIGGDILQISWAWSIYLAITGFGAIAVGKFSDRLNKKHIMLFGYLINVLLTFGYVFVSTPLQLFVLQAGFGLAVALMNPTWYALYSEYSEKKKEGLFWGLAEGEARFMLAIAILVGGLIVELGSFYLLFLVMGTLQFCVFIYTLQVLRRD